ncbi:hypothetical protein V7R84_07510 [Arachnia propionica]|uniref:hypothetical protein n=1 Tax=Arachnia propionica TaxID=1750 RepID=UPI0030CAA06E
MKTWNTVLRLSAALLLVLLPLGSCAPAANRDSSPAPPFSLSLEDAGNSYSPFTAPTLDGTAWDLNNSMMLARGPSVHSTPFGIIVIINTYYPLDTSPKSNDTETTKILCLDPASGSLKWARILEPASSENHHNSAGTAQDILNSLEPARIVTSPDGHHLAIMVKPYLVSRSSSDASDQRMHIVILDTETGNATRTVEVSGLVLGQALTNDSLVVETSQHFYPAGTGALNVFSFTDPQAEPTSFRTDRWLAGATSDSVLVSSQKMRERGHLPTTLTRISTSGKELGTVTGVTDVHDGSWVFRYQDSEAATAAIRAGSTDKLPEELFNIDSGVAFDITGLDVVSADLSTGSGFLLQRSVPDDADQQKTSYVPVAWLPATPDGKELRTDDAAWFREGDPHKRESLYTMRTIRMGEKPD